MAAPLLVEELQRQQGEEGGGGGDHVGAGVVGLSHQVVEAEAGQQGEKEEQAGHTGRERSPRGEIEGAAVGDGRRQGAGDGLRVGLGAGSAAGLGEEKGGGASRRHRERNWWTSCRREPEVYPNSRATCSWGRRSRKTARRAS